MGSVNFLSWFKSPLTKLWFVVTSVLLSVPVPFVLHPDAKCFISTCALRSSKWTIYVLLHIYLHKSSWERTLLSYQLLRSRYPKWCLLKRQIIRVQSLLLIVAVVCILLVYSVELRLYPGLFASPECPLVCKVTSKSKITHNNKNNQKHFYYSYSTSYLKTIVSLEVLVESGE